MGLLDNILKNTANKLANQATSEVTGAARHAVQDAKNLLAKGASNMVHNAINTKKEKFSFASVPQNVLELKGYPEASLKTPAASAALCMAALLRYETSPEDCLAMIDYLKGPGEVSGFEAEFFRERLDDTPYKVRSFFAGATVENNYTPNKPYTITITTNEYSYPEENYATMWVSSAGTDTLRSIRLRKKPSTGQWFIIEIQCLSDIRTPTELDPWA